MGLLNILVWNGTFCFGMAFGATMGVSIPALRLYRHIHPGTYVPHPGIVLLCGFLSWFFLTWPAYKAVRLAPMAPQCGRPKCPSRGYKVVRVVRHGSIDYAEHHCVNCGQIMMVVPYRAIFLNDDRTIQRILRSVYPHFLGLWWLSADENLRGISAL